MLNFDMCKACRIDT